MDPEFKYKLCGGIASLLARLGAKDVVLSPGSRSAPLALSFLREKHIRHKMVPDERSAAFVALGIAKIKQQPVCLICTSATAVLNYAPAIAEAYFSETPLIALTADRPAEWVGQQDNQAIYQENVFANNILKSFSINTEDEHSDNVWFAERTINEAFHVANGAESKKGPVHINMPFREPLYPEAANNKSEPLQLKKISNYTSQEQNFNIPGNFLFSSEKKVMIACGNALPSEALSAALKSFTQNTKAVFLPDVASNQNHIPGAFPDFDLLLKNADQSLKNDLQPDVLITFGGAFVSKKLKEFLRSYPPEKHIHLQKGDSIIDTFQSVTDKISIEPETFFSALIKKYQDQTFSETYRETWQKVHEAVKNSIKTYIETDKTYSELWAVAGLLREIPAGSGLHLGNSLPVRLVSWLQSWLPDTVSVYSNRGTSGIDGCLSTACGAAAADPQSLHFLIIGDLSFFYDRNGLLMPELPKNLRIMVLNNNGGGIFRHLPGAAAQNELEEYFVMPHGLKTGHTAAQHNAGYLLATNRESYQPAINAFCNRADKCTILEILPDAEENFRAIRSFQENLNVEAKELKSQKDVF